MGKQPTTQAGGLTEDEERARLAAEAERMAAYERQQNAEREKVELEAREREAARRRDREAEEQRRANAAEHLRAQHDAEEQRVADARALAEAQAREVARERMDRSGHRLEVRGPVGGRWRAGRHFTVVPTIIEPGVLTKAEREMIDADPVLAVRATETD